MYFTDSTSVVFLKRSRSFASHLRRGLLYTYILCLFNTIFFAPINHLSFYDANTRQTSISYDLDSSLLEIILENYFGAPLSSTDHQDDEDEVIQKVEYISPLYSCLLHSTYQENTMNIPFIQAFIPTPSIGIIKPPPKQVA